MKEFLVIEVFSCILHGVKLGDKTMRDMVLLERNKYLAKNFASIVCHH